MIASCRRLLKLSWGFVRSALFIINNLYAIPVYLCWMVVLSPLRWIWPALLSRVEAFLFHSLLVMVAVLSDAAQYQLVELGDDLDQLADQRVLFLVNHQSTADVPLLMTMLASRRARQHCVFWIMDAIFKWTHFGMVSQLRGDFFVECGKERRDKSVQELRDFLTEHYISLKRKWIFLFPEGGFLYKRRKASQKYAEKLGLPVLQHVTLPRVGAAGAVMQQLGPAAPSGQCNGAGDSTVDSCLRYVVEVTLAYPERDRPLHLLSLMSGYRPPCTVYLYYRVYAADEVPAANEPLQRWLYARYTEKESALSEYYATGKFPHMPGGRSAGAAQSLRPRPVPFDLLDYLLRQAFFLSSVALFLRITTLLWSGLLALVPAIW